MNAQHARDTYQQLAPLGIIKAELDNLEFLIEGANEHGLHCVDWNEYTEFSIPWEQLASVVYYGLDPIWERDGVVCSDLVKLGE